jgi:hypothetical protein
MERPLGQIFNHKGMQIVVVEGDDCDKCFNDVNMERCVQFGECKAWYRKDGRSVIFKLAR